MDYWTWGAHVDLLARCTLQAYMDSVLAAALAFAAQCCAGSRLQRWRHPLAAHASHRAMRRVLGGLAFSRHSALLRCCKQCLPLWHAPL